MHWTLRLRYRPDKGFLACLGTFQVSAFLEKTKCLAFKTMSSMLKNRFKRSLKLNKNGFEQVSFIVISENIVVFGPKLIIFLCKHACYVLAVV